MVILIARGMLVPGREYADVPTAFSVAAEKAANAVEAADQEPCHDGDAAHDQECGERDEQERENDREGRDRDKQPEKSQLLAMAPGNVPLDTHVQS